MFSDVKKLISLPLYILKGVSYHLGGSLFTPKPRMIQFPVCDRCNARCLMCNRWQKDEKEEISIEKIREIFSNSLFSKVEEAHLHGGEPTLRRDLSEISQIIQEACPKLKRLSISTNGFGSRRIEKRIREILRILDFRRIKSFEVSVSIDGLEETHDRIRGVKGGFEQSVETIRILKKLTEDFPFSVSMGTVIQPLNLFQIDELENLSLSLNIPINFQPLMFDKFFNIKHDSNLKFNKDAREKLKEIVKNKLIKGSSTKSFYWCDFLSMMDGSRRKSPCAFDRYVFSIYPTGEVLPCSREDWIMFGNVYDQAVDEIWFSQKSKEIRKRMRKDVCPSCNFYCMVEFSLQKEFFTYLNFYLKKKASNFFYILRTNGVNK